VKHRIPLIIICAALFAPSAAIAHPAAPQRLTFHRAKMALRANAKLDKPSRVTVSECHRTAFSMRRIDCWVVETHATTLIKINGVDAMGTLSGEMQVDLTPRGLAVWGI
jgi:hypothetical protein